eukprot:m.106154 g.106154  ORF g.106154 m.106154 type:complete len:52 (+) comp13897_c0_seq2:1224-1379(+)
MCASQFTVGEYESMICGDCEPPSMLESFLSFVTSIMEKIPQSGLKLWLKGA